MIRSPRLPHWLALPLPLPLPLFLLVATELAGQSSPTFGSATFAAATRLLDPTRGSAAPALWLGFDLEVERPAFGVRLSSAASPAWRGGWGGEGAFSAWYRRSIGSRAAVLGSLDAAIDQPAAYAGAGELGARAALERRFGAVAVRAGAMTIGRFLPAHTQLVGGFAASTWDLGRGLQLSGEIGRAPSLSGSAGSLLPGDRTPAEDTLASSVGGARTLGHLAVGARLRRSWIELTGRLLRRSGLEPAEGVGWEAGLALAAVPGARIRVAAGRAPTAESVYLPYRRQLSIGLEFVRGRPRAAPGDGPLAARPPLAPGFELFQGSPGSATLIVRHAAAGRVELVGDFTAWEPLELAAWAPGVWRATVALAPGIHQVNVRFDGGPWRVPEGLSSTDDGFGGRVGVLVVR